MGMDVYGKNPASETGKYFRNNCWWWRPLARYACSVAPSVTAACEYWQSNDGDGLDEDGAEELAEALQTALDSGHTAKYAKDHEAHIKALPRKSCYLCEGTGVRTDSCGIENGFDRKIVPEPSEHDEDTAPHPRAGQIGWCNACDGRGTVPDDETHYPFSVENVQNFVAFLRDCGGFEIC